VEETVEDLADGLPTLDELPPPPPMPEQPVSEELPPLLPQRTLVPPRSGYRSDIPPDEDIGHAKF
jgi:hypothetical protein